MVKMTHPRHGVTHAVGAEVEWNQKAGWTIETPAPESTPAVEANPKPAEVTERTVLSPKGPFKGGGI